MRRIGIICTSGPKYVVSVVLSDWDFRIKAFKFWRLLVDVWLCYAAHAQKQRLSSFRSQFLCGLYTVDRNAVPSWHLILLNYLEQEAQLPLRNRASAMYFFVAKLLSIAVMTYSYVCHFRNVRPANLLRLRTQRINFSMRPQYVAWRATRPHCRLKSPF